MQSTSPEEESPMKVRKCLSCVPLDCVSDIFAKTEVVLCLFIDKNLQWLDRLTTLEEKFFLATSL